MLDDAIKRFFAERRSGWLKKKVKASMPEEEKTRIEKETEEKFSMDNWLPDAARRVAQLSMVSHPSKFSHPSSRISSIIANGTKKADGFLRTGNSEAALDVFGNASALDVYKFLSLKLDDGKMLIEHVEQGSETARQQLAINTASFNEIQKGLLSIKQGGDTIVTSGKVKQVYFPCDGGYHLLSILTPSGLMFELRNRVNDMRFSEQTKEARKLKKNDDYSDNGYDDLFNLSLIGFGGTKPQNISVLNNQNGGKAYLLPCLPPVLQKRNVRLPRYNFFTNTLCVGRFKDSFRSLQKLMQQEYSNSKIRQGRDSIIRFIVDQVIGVMWSIRNHEAEWSQTEHYSHLPVHQKMWLDNLWLQEREDSDDWLNKVVEEFSRWIVLTYNKLQGKQGSSWGDDELLHVKTLVEQSREALR
jgi:CRISPR-associated protein Csy1